MKIRTVNTANEKDLIEVHERRIGSAAICSVAGLNPFETPLQLWLKKTGRVERDPENDAMWLGTKLEPVVAEMFARTWPTPIVKNNLSAISEENDWMVATPDYLIADIQGRTEMLLEIKTTSAWAKQKWEVAIPDYAHCQVQWQMGIWGYSQAKIACLCGGRDLIVKECVFEKDIFEQLIELGERFMEFVKTDTPPEVKGEDIDALKKLLLPTPGKVSDLTAEMAEFAQKYLESKREIARLKDAIKPHEDNCKIMEVHIRQLLGDATLASNSDYEIERRRTLRKSYTVKESWTDSLRVKFLKENESEENGD